MKKALSLALVFMVGLSVAAFAGFYFSMENTGYDLEPTLTIGGKFAESFGSQTPASILSGDVYAVIPNIFAKIKKDTAWEFGAEVGLTLEYFDCSLEGYLAVNPSLYPASVELVEPSRFLLLFIGKPITIFEVWAGGGFVYDETEDVWNLEPVFGFEAHW